MRYLAFLYLLFTVYTPTAPKVGGSFFFIVISLFGFLLLINKNKKYFDKFEYKLITYVFLFYFAVIFFSAFHFVFSGGEFEYSYSYIDHAFRFALVSPVIAFIVYSKFTEEDYWKTILLVSVAMIFTDFYYLISREGFLKRYWFDSVFTHSIAVGLYANFILFNLLYGKKYIIQIISSNWLRISLIVGIVIVIVHTGSRMSWLMSMLIICTYLYTYSKFIVRAAYVVVFTLIIVAIMSVPNPVKDRVNKTIDNISSYSLGNTGTSVGQRFEMWKMSLYMFSESPLIGMGVGSYEASVRSYVDEYHFNHKIENKHSPHNEYLYSLSSSGIVGLISLLAVFLSPLYLFVQRVKRDPNDVYSLNGIGLVSIYIIYSFTNDVFQGNSVSAYYVFCVALLLVMSMRVNHE